MSIKREGQGLTVTLYTGGWPRTCEITLTDRSDLLSFRLFTTAQIRALHFMLGEVLASDPSPDKGI